MKNLLLGLLLGIFVASVQQAYTRQQPERIAVGSTSLQLGMPHDAVISKLAEQGYKVTKLSGPPGSTSDMWIATEKNDQTREDDIVVTFDFINNRLQRVTRAWVNNWDNDSAKIGKNFYFLVKSMEESGNSVCTLETKSQEGPDLDSKVSLIHCGKRTVSVGVSKYKEQHEETQVTETVK
jgi:hypothetical protein